MINHTICMIYHNNMSYNSLEVGENNDDRNRNWGSNMTTCNQVLSWTVKIIGVIALITVIVMTITITTILIKTYHDITPMIQKGDDIMNKFNTISDQIIKDGDKITQSIYLIRKDIDNITIETRIGSNYLQQMANDLNKIARRIGK